MSQTAEVARELELGEERQDELSYSERRKPASEFESRDQFLDHELTIMNPKRWGVNLPFRDFGIEMEDWVPALAATIGKVVMVAAVVGVFAAQFGLSPAFIA